MSAREILLIEDETVQSEIVIRYFQGYRIANPIRVLADGQQALAYILAQPEPLLPTLMLLDLNLPGLNGLEILRELRSRPETRQLRVIILTASPDPFDESESLSLGVLSYLRKPIKFNELAAILEKLGLGWHIIDQDEQLPR